MDKNETLEELKTMLAQGDITKDEVMNVVRTIDQGTLQMPGSIHKRFNLAQVLYYVGGGIVVIGISVLIGENWRSLNSAVRILTTIGVAMASYITALLLSRQEKTQQLSQAFYFIASVVLPIGLGVTFHEAGYQIGTISIETIIASIAFLFLLLSFLLTKRVVLLLFSILYGIITFFILTTYLTQGSPIFVQYHFTEYRFLVVGLTLCLLGYGLQKGNFKMLTGTLYGFGVISFLGSAMALGGFKPSQNLFWEIIYPGLVFGVILLSIYLKSKSFLVFGALFLMAYIIKITGEYFTSNLGWPLALVVAGLALMGIGYMTVFVNKRYLVRPIAGSLPHS